MVIAPVYPTQSQVTAAALVELEAPAIPTVS